MMAPTIDPEAIFAELRANEAQWQRRAVEAQAQAAHAIARFQQDLQCLAAWRIKVNH